MNKVFLMGRLGNNPEVKTANGQQLAKFSLATTETYKDKLGEKKEQTEWHNITVWGKLAEVAGKYLTKGSQVLVEGKICNKNYEKDGEKKYYTEILASSFQMIGGKAEPSKPSNEQSATSNQDGLNLPF